jgi:hypothetical protein
MKRLVVLNVFIILLLSISSLNAGAQPLKKAYKKPAATLDIKPQEYFNIGGTVFAGTLPLQVFDASLYYRYTDMYLFIQKVHFDTLGYYYFMNLPEGYYAVKAEPLPGTNESRQYVPTYTGNALHWQDAEVPYLNSNFFTADIHLLEAMPPVPGPAGINGQLVHSNKIEGGKQEPIRNAEILLEDPQGTPIAYINTDMNGFFNFPQLDWGYYLVYPEVAGINTIPMMVNLNPGHPSAFITFSMDEHQIVAGGLATTEALDQVFSAPYPLPATDEVKVDYSLPQAAQVTLSISDLAGRFLEGPQIVELQCHGTLLFDVHHFSPGTYLLRLEMDGQGTYLQKLVVIR